MKISCGGFFFDDDYFLLTKNEFGQPVFTARPEVLRGVKGEKGDKGDPFTVSKIYTSIEAMEADHDNPEVEMDSFVLIESGTGEGEDDGKLYIKDIDGFDYITNLTGAQGIKGEKGDTGVGVPTGGLQNQVLVKNGAEDFVTKWEDVGNLIDLSPYAQTEDIQDSLLPTVTEEEDNGKIAQVVNGVWDMRHIEFGEIIHAATATSIGSDNVPLLTTEQVQSAYNSFVAGKSVAVTSVDGKKYYAIVGADSSDSDNIKVVMMYGDKYIITYNHLGLVSDYKEILEGEVVTLSREYATAPNDHGFYREWSPNLQGKVWVECGVFITTVALSVGSRVPLPVTFEDSNFHVQVTVMAMGNYSAKAYRGTDNRSINVVVTDYYGTAQACPICVEAKGWKAI